ncbi:hypothetical protein V8C26DRAFT_412735 [Trichoderma gracile]
MKYNDWKCLLSLISTSLFCRSFCVLTARTCILSKLRTTQKRMVMPHSNLAAYSGGLTNKTTAAAYQSIIGCSHSTAAPINPRIDQ